MSSFNKCDFCGKEIKGNYYKLESRFNDDSLFFGGHVIPFSSTRDVCEECVEFLKKAKGETYNE